jgi:hypothetical protein
MTDEEYIKIMEKIAGRKLFDHEKLFCLMVKDNNFRNVKAGDDDEKI